MARVMRTRNGDLKEGWVNTNVDRRLFGIADSRSAIMELRLWEEPEPREVD